ncbi:MAG: hypothetical protein HQM00_08565 [Magnetococcales bacterium]|nr:hypothetical protein [Magnetococcales bacterium]
MLKQNEVQQNPPETRTTRLIPVTKWPELHSWPSIGGLRHLIFNAETNGFSSVIKRAGRRVLIDEAAFFRWMDKQNGGVK